MKYTGNSLNILTAKSYKGIGNAWIVKNLKGNESIEVIVSLLNNFTPSAIGCSNPYTPTTFGPFLNCIDPKTFLSANVK